MGNWTSERYKEDKELLKKLYTYTTDQVLQEFSKFETIPEKYTRAVSDIKKTYELPTPVMNILIHYSLMKNKITVIKPYMDKVASHWARLNVKTITGAIDCFSIPDDNNKSSKKDSSKVEDTVIKPFTVFETSFMEKIEYRYSIPSEISKEIVIYGRIINQGLLINWFVDSVADYIYRNDAFTVDEARKYIQEFHNKYVKDFGKD